jgi:hypothetical protein
VGHGRDDNGRRCRRECEDELSGRHGTTTRRRGVSIRRNCLFRGAWEPLIVSTFLLGEATSGINDLALAPERSLSCNFSFLVSETL